MKTLNLRAISFSLALCDFDRNSNKEYKQVVNNINLKPKDFTPDFIYDNFLKDT